MGEYNFTLHHKPGKTNIKPDILSRRPDLKRREKDNENITMLKEHHFRTQEFIFESLNDNFLRSVRASRKSRDRMVEKALLGRRRIGQNRMTGLLPGVTGFMFQRTRSCERIS